MPDTDIASFDIALPDGWHEIPLHGDDAWPSRTARGFGVPDVEQTLATQLTAVRDSVRGYGEGRTTAAAFVPYPETGRVAGVLAVALTAVSALGSPDALEEALRTQAAGDGSQAYHVQTWCADVDAGLLVGAHCMLVHPDAAGGAPLEERVIATVYPPGAAQAVQLIASAAGLSDFDDMAQSVQDIAQTLRVRREES